jgi:hypothetical protein
MNSTLQKGLSMFPRALALSVTVVAAALIQASGCAFSDNHTHEGDRCNPLDVHNECATGLVCTGQGSSPAIAFCPENYCCPLDSSGNITGGNANCQPGCNGGAASICKATNDPGACAFSTGTPLAAAQAMDEDGGASTDDASSEAGASEAGSSEAGTSEAGAADDASSEAGPSEAGSSEAGLSEAGPSEAGTSDAGDQ